VKPNQDAFGQALYDYYQGEPIHEILERDDGFISVGKEDLNSYFSPYSQWPSSLKQAIGYANGKTLDIGCGAGRAAMYLQRKGFDVTGMDISPLALKVSRLRGLKKTKVLSITDLQPGMGPFDTLVLFGNNFGLLGGFNRARRLLKIFFKMTSPAARIIAQTLDPYKTSCREHLDYHRRNRAKGRMGGQIRMRCRYRNLIDPWFDYLFVSKKEMKEILEGTGWKVIKFISSTGPNYVAIIEKESA
jgi:SAM-dependent methyltransferase